MPDQTPQQPSIGRVVHYHSKEDDGVISPALVLRTRDSASPDVLDAWRIADDAKFGVQCWGDEVVELVDDYTVDLLVHSLGGDYREYGVPFAETPTPGHWNWPPRV